MLEKLEKINNLGQETKDLIFEAKMLANVKKLDDNLIGSNVEEKVFDKIGAALKKLKIKDTVVFNGWNVTKKCEFDFLIVSEPLKTIFQIEIKRRRTNDDRKKAATQLKKGFDLFSSTIPFNVNNNWKYVRAMYFGWDKKGKEFNSCDYGYCYFCQSHILGPNTDFEVWWEQMTENITNEDNVHQQNEDDQSRTVYLDIVWYLICRLYLQRETITKQEILKQTLQNIESTSTPEKLFFWSRIQFSLLTDVTKTRVAFISEYGTGKTILLKAKAKQLASKPKERVVFVFIKDIEKETLLQCSYKEELKGYNVKFCEITPTGRNICRKF